MNDIANLIATLGFPIVCCIGLGLYINQRDKAFREDNEKDKDRLYSEISYNREVNKELLEVNRMLAKDVKGDLEEIKTLITK